MLFANNVSFYFCFFLHHPATDIKDLPGAISPSEMRDKFGLKDGAENPLMKRRWYIQVGGEKQEAVIVLEVSILAS